MTPGKLFLTAGWTLTRCRPGCQPEHRQVPQNVLYGPKPGGAGCAYSSRPGRCVYGLCIQQRQCKQSLQSVVAQSGRIGRRDGDDAASSQAPSVASRNGASVATGLNCQLQQFRRRGLYSIPERCGAMVAAETGERRTLRLCGPTKRFGRFGPGEMAGIVPCGAVWHRGWKSLPSIPTVSWLAGRQLSEVL